jgi:hypothetical protein
MVTFQLTARGARRHFEELLTLVRNHFKKPPNATYGLHLVGGAKNSPAQQFQSNREWIVLNM